MEFPMIQIDLRKWNLEIISELLLFDTYYYSRDNKFYDHYILNKTFLSSNGILYKARQKRQEKIFFSLLGIRPKYRICFEKTDICWTFDQAKEFFIDRITSITEEAAKENWLKAIDSATNIRELIEAEEK